MAKKYKKNRKPKRANKGRRRPELSAAQRKRLGRKALEASGRSEPPPPTSDDGPGGSSQYVRDRKPLSPGTRKEIKRNQVESRKQEKARKKWEGSKEGRKSLAEQNEKAEGQERRLSTLEENLRHVPFRNDYFYLSACDPDAVLALLEQFILLYPTKHENQILCWLRDAVEDMHKWQRKPKRGRGRPTHQVQKWADPTRRRYQGAQLAEVTASIDGTYSRTKEETVRQGIRKYERAIVGEIMRFKAEFLTHSETEKGMLDSQTLQRRLSERYALRFPEDQELLYAILRKLAAGYLEVA